MSVRPQQFRPVTASEPGAGGPRPVVFAALGVGVLAAVLLVVGAVAPVVEGANPGFASGPLLVVLAVAPAALACGLAARGRYTTACGVLVGVATLAPGRTLLDLQFAADPTVTARPELYLPTRVEMAAPDIGLWALLAGHACSAIAGLVAARRLRQHAEQVGLREPARQRWVVATVLVGVLAACGMVMAPLHSSTAYLVAGNAFENPPAALIGWLLVAGALPLAGAVGMSATVGEVSRGALLGVATGAAVVAVPPLVSGWSVPSLQGSAGPVVALIGAVGLGGLAFAPFGEADATDEVEPGGEATLPGRTRLQFVSGVLAVLTGVAAVLGSLAAQVVAEGPVTAPESPASGLLFTAGVVVVVLGVAMLLPSIAARVRPTLSVAWVSILVAGTAVLDTALAATEFRGVLVPGSGVIWTAIAMLGALVTACCCVVAGMLEREDADDVQATQGPASLRASPGLLTALVAAGILLVGGYAFPAIAAPDYSAPALLSGFGAPTWGLLFGLVVVLGAAGITPRSRPARGAALLLGAAVVAGLRAAELPLASSGIDGVRAGIGTWLALAAVLALVLAALLGANGRRTATTVT